MNRNTVETKAAAAIVTGLLLKIRAFSPHPHSLAKAVSYN
jgi:hypothetical protein